jgi:hypothetical protein
MAESYNPLSKKIENYENDLEIKKKIMELKIIKKNYNKEQFLDFCKAKRIDGNNLNRWTISEFQQIVDEYLKYHQDVNYRIDENEINLNEEKENKEKKLKEENEINNQILEIQNSQMSISNEITEINCKKLEKNILNDKKVIIEVKNPKIISASYFQVNYIQYEVYTNITNWLVYRRYSDFEWLRYNLRKLYPKYFCPPIPNKKIGSRRFENDFVEKRMKFLNKFINSVCENEIFKTSEPLIAFLSLQDRTQFEEKMKEINSFTPSNFVEDVKNFDGIVKLIEDNNNQYYKNISNYFKLQSQVLDRLNYNLKQYYYNISAACMNLDEVYNDFNNLFNLNKRINMKEEIFKTYEILSVFFKNWKRILFNQNEIIKNNIKDFYKYINMETDSFNELLLERDLIKNTYDYEHNRLLSKKEKLWDNGDITKYEILDEYNSVDNLVLLRDKKYAFNIMCTRETQIENNLHKQLNYTNWMYNEELNSLINRNSEKFVENIKIFCDNIYPTLNDSFNVWSEIASYTNSTEVK